MAFHQFSLPQQYGNPDQPPESCGEQHQGRTASRGENEHDLIMQQGLAVQGPGGIPVHPHLLPMRHSREYSCSSPISTNLSSYRNNLLSTLNSERWGHHRTVQNMEQELAYHRQEIWDLQQGCGMWAQAWHNLNDELIRSETDRIGLLREMVSLRADMELLQEAQQTLLQERTEANNRLELDMSSAKDRQIHVLRRRLSRRESPSPTRTSSEERLSCKVPGLKIGDVHRAPILIAPKSF